MTQYCSFTYKDLLTQKALISAFIISIGLALLFIRSGGLSLEQHSISSNNHSHNLNSQKLVNSNSNTLCCLIRLHSVHLSYLPVLALSLSYAGFDKIHAYVVSIDPSIDKQLLHRKMDMINTIAQRVNYITYLELGPAEPNDFGYSPLDHALTYLYNQHEHSPSACEYVLSTNGDNFYSSELRKVVLPHMEAKKDIIAWDFITRYGGPKCVPVALRLASADLGSAAYRVAFLKQHKLHFNYLNKPYDHLGDAYFIESAAKLSNGTVLLRQTLFIHQ